MSSDFLNLFTERLREAGLVLHGGIQADGRLHRCGVEGKPKGQDGAYRIHLYAPASAWWQNWRTGESGTWTAKADKDLTDAERQALRQRIEEDKATRQAEQERRWAAAAKLARSVWEAAAPATDEHPYLVKKQVPPLGLRQSKDGRLIVPVLGGDGKVQSLQFIAGDGGKLFLSGGKTAGGFFPLPAKDGSKTEPLVIAEGYATAASVHLATGYACLVAFNAGNLEAVATMARAKYPKREIILAADNDVLTDGNPGVTKATAAAQAVGGKLAICPAHEGRATDFNDLHRWRSLEAVRAVVEAAQTASLPEPEEKLPAGFSIRTGGPMPGLWHTEVREGADPVETWVGGMLAVLGATRDEKGTAWGLLLEWPDADGTSHTWAMPKAMLAGRDSSAVIARLADEGWRFAAGQKARNLFYKFLAEYETRKRVLCVPSTGWHHGAFVFPDATIKNMSDVVGRVGRPYGDKDFQTSDKEKTCRTMSDGLGDERIVLQVQTAHNPFRTAGALDGWRESIGNRSRGNSRIMLALCASLAAVLLEPSGLESGGINWTGSSSTGKTTALVVGGSVWGRGASSGGYVQNWRATSNGLEGLAALHSDAALCLDEIGQAPGRTIQEAAYMLANGMGKGRAYQDGSAKAIRSWRCMVLSTGEKGLAEKIADEGGHVQAGQLVRLIDVPADAGAGMGIFEDLHGHESPQAFADALKRAAATDYGHAARAFISKVQEHRDEAQKDLAGFLDRGSENFCPADADGQVRRVARRFLLCAAAGEMAAEWGILPWGEGEAVQAVRTCFEAWLTLRGGIGAAEDTAIVEQVRLFLEQHGQSRFQDMDRPDAVCINRVGFRREGADGITVYYVLPESFKEVVKGHATDKAARVLRDIGILQPDGKRLKRWLPSLPGMGRQAGYVLSVGGEHEDS
ncbi:DUF927 domain-containing protein [uncultured Desulfovibrio sp.]|uniref:DUF927 domain-containing protein n=1 Tax=uncultured Desulfovibrio sp. TaxID=167968 RepID=UPI00260E25B8|nr:DUF927 domain-containing protein [uncultured Desulfovibrio sp.]